MDPRRLDPPGDTAGLCPPLPAGLGRCVVCRGPAHARFLRCFQCSLHWQGAPGLLADTVVPLSYSVAGTEYARMLWLYKSQATTGRRRARRCAGCCSSSCTITVPASGRSAGIAAPRHVAVVPSGRGRPGVHPLRALVEPYLALPWAAWSPPR